MTDVANTRFEDELLITRLRALRYTSSWEERFINTVHNHLNHGYAVVMTVGERQTANRILDEREFK